MLNGTKTVLLATAEPKLNDAISKNASNFGILITGMVENESTFVAAIQEQIPDIILTSKRFEFNNLSVVN